MGSLGHVNHLSQSASDIEQQSEVQAGATSLLAMGERGKEEKEVQTMAAP